MNEEYEFTDKTLLHSVGCNLFKLDNILKYGILSKTEAMKKGVLFAKNYEGANLDDFISVVEYKNIDKEDFFGAYEKYITKGITFVIEGVETTNQIFKNHLDEAYVESIIPQENIKAILISELHRDTKLSKLPIMPKDPKSYMNIKCNVDNMLTYLINTYNYDIHKNKYNEKLKSLYDSYKELTKDPDKTLIKKRMYDVNNSKKDFLKYASKEVNACFKQVLETDEVTLYDAVSYINNKYSNIPIYTLNEEQMGRRR